ncbi:MAG: DHHA1 domain-containing protein, partial [Alphaproteobacteria bacterium]|nr:DHHA1 domain-containing protein [Alphaproteobacteria bacterium]
TVCDMVPLIGVNRAFVTKGLLAMRRGLNPGLSALAMKASLQFPPNVQTLGFVFGPRINAGGRLGRAHLGARLLSSSDLNEVQEIAVTLERMNKERREIEQEILEEALAEAMYLMNMDPDMSLILIGKENWHPGVMGLIASRLKDHFCRPAIVLSFDHNGNGVGSGRSVPGLDLGRAVRAAVDAGLLVKGGGHSMAVGLSVKKVNLENLRTFLKEFLLCSGGENQGIDELICDGALTAGAAVPELIKSLETVGPFGIGNPEPCFVFPSHRLSGVRIVGKVHLRCLVKGKDGGSVKAILYHSVSTPLGRFLLEHSGRLPVHVAGFLGIDYWGGTCRAQLRIVDVAEVPEK